MIHKNRKKALALAISSALISMVAHAQDQQAGPAASPDEAVEEVIVKGVRASQAKSVDIKRQNDKVVDSIVAEDIGKLPDTTITDSLQRVTGVQITREANEGTSLNVRGMPQVLTTLNGEQFLSPWNITNVGANYSDIPAGLINGVDVYKSQSANTLAGGISGVVDLKTIKPLSLKSGWTGNVKIEATQGSLSKNEIKKDGTEGSRQPDTNVNFFVGNNFDDTFGVTLGGFKSTTYSADYQMYEDQRLAFLNDKGGTPSDPLDLDGDGDKVGDWYMVPAEFGARSNFMERERQGGAMSIEFAPNDNFKIRGDVFYTEMTQHDRGVKAAFNGRNTPESYEINGNAALYATDVYNVLQPGSVVQEGGKFSYVDAQGQTQTRSLNTVRVADIWAADFQSISTTQINKTAALNTNLQVDYTNNDNFEASLRYVYAKAEKQFRQATFQQGAPGWLWVDNDGINGKDPVAGYHVTVDYRGKVPSFSYTDDLSDANLLKQYQGFADGDSTEADLNVIRGDAKYTFDGDFIESVEMGFRFGDRTADYEKFYYVTPTSRYSTWDDPRVPASKRYKLRSGNQVWQKYPEWLTFDFAAENPNLVAVGGLVDNGFSRADTYVFKDFGPIKGFEKGVSSLNPAAWDDPLAFMNRLYPGTKTVKDPSYTYSVEETTASAYSQFNFKNDEGIWGIPFKGNLGLQIVTTDRSVDKYVLPDVLDVTNSIGSAQAWNTIAFVSTRQTVKTSFVDVFPSVNLNFFPNDDMVVRLGATRTTSRNDLDNVGSGLFLWYQECPKTELDSTGKPVRVTVHDGNGKEVGDTVSCVGGGSDKGNPYIKPWLANVYNSSWEWYFDQNSILGVGLFLIDVKNSVENYQELRHFVDGDGIDRNNVANMYVAKNVGASSLYGLEVGYKQPFTFLPGKILSSTGMEFNYTYSMSEAAERDLNGTHFPLPSNSKQQSNLILWYDKDGLNIRLAYNWRSEEYLGRVGLNNNTTTFNLGNWLEPTGYLDLSVNYSLNQHVNFSLSGTNLTEQNRKSYSQYTGQFNSIYIQETRYTAGVTFSL